MLTRWFIESKLSLHKTVGLWGYIFKYGNTIRIQNILNVNSELCS